MVTIPAHAPAPTSTNLAAAILEALAEVRAVGVADLQPEMASAGGDLEIDSREAEAIIAMLEARYARELAKVEDLEPECLLSVASLAALIGKRWHTGRALPTGGTP